MKKVLAVFGATGQQGGSVIEFVLNNARLSTEFSVRAVTRDTSSPTIESFRERGVEAVNGDFDDPESLTSALVQTHTVFILTMTVYDDQLKEREFRRGKAIADAAVAAGAQHLIFSTCVASELFSSQPVAVYDSKADVEAYIRTLPVKSSFFAPGMFMQNFLTYQAPRRHLPDENMKHANHKDREETFVISNIISPDAVFPLLETIEDTGKFIGTILLAPEEFAGKTLYAATALYTYRQCAEIITSYTGKKTVYIQLSNKEWIESLPARWPGVLLTTMMEFIEDPGYFGPETNNLVEGTVHNIEAKLTSLEQFVEKHAGEICH